MQLFQETRLRETRSGLLAVGLTALFSAGCAAVRPDSVEPERAEADALERETPGCEPAGEPRPEAEAYPLGAVDPDSFVDGMSYSSRSEIGRLRGFFPNIVLTTHEGEEVRFYDDLVADRVVLINFMYTVCTGI